MSRLNDLLRQLRLKDSALADDLQREVDALADRRSFGLNFERHVPEAVELPGRQVRRGDKVRILPPRGITPTTANQRLWRVLGTSSSQATLEAMEGGEPRDVASSSIDDLVVVAEFRDPIYPGLLSTGKVERGGDKPFHTVINAENYHALQTLLFTHRGKVDCIYIDPPYNTGARDWKYNNDYVESDDHYRHSKWLAFMERRLLLAKELLDPTDSVMIVTIDEKEVSRLGLLLQQTFPDARIQMVSSVIAQKGVARAQQFYRTDEYIFFVAAGQAAVVKQVLSSDWRLGKGDSPAAAGVVWSQLRRSGTNSTRQDRPTLFYPIYIDPTGPNIHSVGESLPLGTDPSTARTPNGLEAIWPVRADGTEGNWQQSQTALKALLDQGYVRIGRLNIDGYPLSYLKRGSIDKIVSGQIKVIGRDPNSGHVLTDSSEYEHQFVPGTSWNLAAHDATYHGTQLLTRFIGQGRFPFPKSLYAVEDAIRFYLSKKPQATIVDFFAGSGTTAHAVMRLNKQDGGRRRSISVTNNEVSGDEQHRLRLQGLRPGDLKWEQWGIFDYVAKPRIEAAITGRTLGGNPISGEYKFTDEFPMAEGFEENVAFFELTYEAPLRVASHREFERIAPLLWLRAGSVGRQIDDVEEGWDVAEAYGVLADLDQIGVFMQALRKQKTTRLAFVVTDEDRLFESVCRDLPDQVEPVRLYESYLRNFEIEAGRGSR